MTFDAPLVTFDAELVTFDAELVPFDAQLVTFNASLVNLDAQIERLEPGLGGFFENRLPVLAFAGNIEGGRQAIVGLRAKSTACLSGFVEVAQLT